MARRLVVLTLLVVLFQLPAISFSQGKARIRTQPSADSTSAVPDHVYASYEGVLPCADCSGIKTTLTLFAPSRHFSMEKTYLGMEGLAMAFGAEGTWTRFKGRPGDPGAVIIRLEEEGPEGTSYFEVVEPDGKGGSALRALDKEMKPIKTKANVTLKRRP